MTDQSFLRNELRSQITIELLDDSDSEVLEIQKLALRLNEKSLRSFLVLGQKPQEGELTLSRDEFLNLFNKK